MAEVIMPKPVKTKDLEKVPEMAHNAIMWANTPMVEGVPHIRGYDFSKGLDYHALLQSFLTTGCQASNFGKAVIEINTMLAERARPVTDKENELPNLDESGRPRSACTIFLGFTSNMISSGVRESLKYIVQHNMVDVLVTTAGAIEEDIIKCFAPTFTGDFRFQGKALYQRGHNRIGNMILPNGNYRFFKEFAHPIFDQMYKEQQEQGASWTPSKVIYRFGKEINHEDSVLYWAYKNNIPVFCPGLTDGSVGDMLYMYSFRQRGLLWDIVDDVRRIDNLAVSAINSAIIVLGGGTAKHHIANANCMRSGAEYAVYINTASEFDGSDSGARPDEAVSWGKIKMDATPVKVYADATLVFPLIVAETFYQHNNNNIKQNGL